MNLSPYELKQAKDGDLFVKKGDKLVAVSFNELSSEIKKQLEGTKNTEALAKANSKAISKISTELQNLVKSHFIAVFSLFELKAFKGEIENVEESLLNLDEKVLSGELSVSEALDQHEYLKSTYEALFGKVGE